MKYKKTSFSFIHMGAPSLLMIFLVLCLFTFALLSLSSAKNNRTLSQQSADRIQTYYQASSLAEEALDQIDTILSDAHTDCGAESADTADYQKEVTEKLENCSVDGVSAFTVDFTKGEGTLAFQVPVSESQQLSVVLTLPAPSDCQNGYYRITQWTTETTDSWDGDDTYQLLSQSADRPFFSLLIFSPHDIFE